MMWEEYTPGEGDEPYPTPLSRWVPALAYAVLIAAVVIAYMVLT
jgi:hypothetical protein